MARRARASRRTFAMGRRATAKEKARRKTKQAAPQDRRRQASPDSYRERETKREMIYPINRITKSNTRLRLVGCLLGCGIRGGDDGEGEPRTMRLPPSAMAMSPARSLPPSSTMRKRPKRERTRTTTPTCLRAQRWAMPMARREARKDVRASPLLRTASPPWTTSKRVP
jgi:hypothetical protein